MRRRRRRTRPAGKLWVIAAGGLLASAGLGKLIAEDAVGQINPVYRVGASALAPTRMRLSPDPDTEDFTALDVPRAIGDELAYGPLEPVVALPVRSTVDTHLNDELDKLEARWRAEDRAFEALHAAATAPSIGEATAMKEDAMPHQVNGAPSAQLVAAEPSIQPAPSPALVQAVERTCEPGGASC